MAKRLTEVEFRLGIEFADYTVPMHKEFVSQFAKLADTEPSNIKTIVIRSGCTILRLRLPDDGAKKFLELFHRHVQQQYTLDNCPEELREFLTRFKVENYTRYRSDLQITVTERTGKRAIAFVHGWTGDQTTFGSWPSLLEAEFGIPSEVFTYPTGILSHSPSTYHLASALGEWIRNRFPGHSMAFITHSLGGLVARRFIVQANNQDDRLDLLAANMVFIASPHGGSAIARLVEKVPVLRSQQVGELSNNSPMLLDLNSRWAQWVSDFVPRTCRIKSYYGTRDPIVTAVDAQGLDPHPIAILGKDHTSIVKPDSETDDVAVSVRRFLVDTNFFRDKPGSDADRERKQAGVMGTLERAGAVAGPASPTAETEGASPGEQDDG